MEELKIPTTATTIGSNAFENCTSLKAIDIPSGVTKIGSGAFKNCVIITKVKIPSAVTSIPSSAFEGCTSLEEVNIPENVTSIGNNAFKGSKISSATIPASVKDINSGAFDGCTNLTEITFYSNPKLNSGAIPSTIACHLILREGIDLNTANANTYASVNYEREMASGKYGTIILTFAPDETALSNYTFFELSSTGDEYITFDEVAEPVANTPYLYKLNEGGENIAFTAGSTTISSTINPKEVGNWSM